VRLLIVGLPLVHFFSDGWKLELPRGRRLNYMFASIIMLQAATIATQYDVDV